MRLNDRVVVLHDDPDKNMLGTIVGSATFFVGEHDFTTMDEPGTLRQTLVVALDYGDQGWLGGDDEQRSHISHLMVHEDALEPAPWYVNVYEQDRGYGGPEEGGWYYDIMTPIRQERFDNRFDAEAHAEFLRAEYPAEGDRPVSSVLYSGGAYIIRVENRPPVAEPQTTPHYE